MINKALHAVEQHIPITGGQVVDQVIQTRVAQMANNAINSEGNKGVGGSIGDIEGFLGEHH